jgi:hypothetical protein
MCKINRYILFLLLLIILGACSNSKSNNKYPAIDVIGYIKGQIKILDSVPYGILKVTERSGQNPDSTYLDKKAFIEHVSPFLHASIDKERLGKEYTETSFADAGLGYVIITYQALEGNAPIQQVSVYIRPDNGSINQVYITGYINPKNELEKNQLLWMHNKGCTIITIQENNIAEPSSITEKIIWQ